MVVVEVILHIIEHNGIIFCIRACIMAWHFSELKDSRFLPLFTVTLGTLLN